MVSAAYLQARFHDVVTVHSKKIKLNSEILYFYFSLSCLFSFQRTSQEREGGRESPRTPEEVSPAAGPSGDVPVDGSLNSSAVNEVTKETMKKKTLSIIDEFLNIKDMKVSARGSLCFSIVVVVVVVFVFLFFFSEWHAPSLSLVCLVWLVVSVLRELSEE